MGGLGDDVEDYGIKGVITTEGAEKYKRGGPEQGAPKCDGDCVGKDNDFYKGGRWLFNVVEEKDETTDAPDVDTPEYRLNKVRDFFGLDTLEGVKANKLLETSADLFKTKNAEHGDAYLKIGYVLESMFPNGLTLKTHHDFNKFTTLVQMLYKITRMCNTCFGEKETIHDSVFDSPRDLSVYGAIFGEIQIHEFKDKIKSDNPL